MAIARERLVRIAKVSLICALAAAANLLVMFPRDLLQVSLFLDTVFTVAVTFALGPVAGVVVAMLTWALGGVLGIGLQRFHPFVLVAVFEVLVVHWLRPASRLPAQGPLRGSEEWDDRVFRLFGVFLRLTTVYAACVVAVSVMGGVIDFLYHTVLGAERPYYTGISVLMTAVSRDGVPTLLWGILSRVQIVFLDRLFVVFGGYLVSLAIARFAGPRPVG